MLKFDPGNVYKDQTLVSLINKKYNRMNIHIIKIHNPKLLCYMYKEYLKYSIVISVWTLICSTTSCVQHSIYFSQGNKSSLSELWGDLRWRFIRRNTRKWRSRSSTEASCRRHFPPSLTSSRECSVCRPKLPPAWTNMSLQVPTVLRRCRYSTGRRMQELLLLLLLFVYMPNKEADQITVV